jgi:hypothetical protein
MQAPPDGLSGFRRVLSKKGDLSARAETWLTAISEGHGEMEPLRASHVSAPRRRRNNYPSTALYETIQMVQNSGRPESSR